MFFSPAHRTYAHYKWRKAVKKATGNVCFITGKKENLEAHHIFDSSTYPELRRVAANGVMLDRKTHRAFHEWMGGYYVSCTLEDIIEFKNHHGNHDLAEAEKL